MNNLIPRDEDRFQPRDYSDALWDFIETKREEREAMREEIQDAYDKGIIDEETYESEMEFWEELDDEDLFDAYDLLEIARDTNSSEDWEAFRETGASP